MVAKEAWSYPQLPPACLASGEACPDCPIAPECGYLAVGKALQDERRALEATHAELGETRVKLEKECVENVRAMHDSLIPGFLSRYGLEKTVEQNKSLQREILEGRCGVLMLDLRGLEYINNTYGHLAGDAYLKHAAARLTGNGSSGLLRSSSPPPEIENRRSNPNLRDILFCRPSGGGDEIVGIVRDITQDDFRLVEQRISSELSIDMAIRDSAQGRAPVIACIGGAHAAVFPPNLGTSPIDQLNVLIGKADEISNQRHAIQYHILWGMAVNVNPALSTRYPLIALEPDKNKWVVMEQFFLTKCPDFAQDPRAMLVAPEGAQ